jgi:hypothetical protein
MGGARARERLTTLRDLLARLARGTRFWLSPEWVLYWFVRDGSQEWTSLQGERGECSAASLAAFVRLDPELQVADRVGLD